MNLGLMLGISMLGAKSSAAVLSITGISPASGSVAGGTPVTISGTGFTGRTSAEVGGVALSSFVVVSDISITGVTGAHAAGAVNITVGGLSATAGYTYVALFDPLSVGTPLVWYDLAHCTQGAGIVTALPDQTANGKNGIFTSGREPTYHATEAAINNLPTMYFPASDTKRVDVPDLLIGAEAFSVVFVSYAISSANPAVFSASDGLVECVPSGGKWAITGDATTTLLVDPAIAFTTPAVVVAVYNNDTTGKLYVNAHTPTSGNVRVALGPNLTGVTLCLGHYKILPDNAGFSLDGPIAFFGVYRGALSAADAAYLQDGLGALAGITIGA